MARTEYCVIGLGRFGTQIASKLNSLGKKVMVIDTDQELINKASKTHEICIKGDATNINFLADSGIKNVKTVVVAISSIDISIMVCSNLKELGMNDIISKASNTIHERVLKSIGIPRVVIPDIEVANKMALQSIYNLGADIVNVGIGISWIKSIVTNKEVIDKPIFQLKIKEKFDGNIMLIQRREKVIFPITKDTTLKIGDVVTIMCRDENIAKIFKYLSRQVFE